jgi:carbonic anhydrase/acetyltransferase-like protein (isoleucine patch superfamily)
MNGNTIPTGHAGIAARLKKGPTVHPTAWIVPGATVIGDVTLEEESSVWFGAVLRGDINRIVIGPRPNIQDRISNDCWRACDGWPQRHRPRVQDRQ